MGYTGFTKKIVSAVINVYATSSVIDLGSQQDYDQPNLPAPYISDWYDGTYGICKDNPDRAYISIDLNGENESITIDLGQPGLDLAPVDLLVDAGTSEHVGADQAFLWAAIYNCWLNKHKLLKEGGIMINENPKSGNWPGHGFNYYTKEFYRNLESVTDYHVILLDEHPAMENRVDGWNVVCVMQKMSDKFPTLEEFMQLGIQQS